MSNKTSDKNVGNKIKQQTENTIKYYKNIDNIEEVPIDILRAMYKDILSDYTRQKQINEEHRKLNGELRERVKELERNSNCDSVYAIKFVTMQQQINEKDKRIQELEEENAMLKKTNNIAKNVNIEDITDVINESCKEFMSNYIPKQAVIDKIKELDIAILECEYDDDDVEEYKNDVEKEKRILLIKKSALEELLEEK